MARREPKAAVVAGMEADMERWLAAALRLPKAQRTAVLWGEDWATPGSPLSRALGAYHRLRVQGDWLHTVESSIDARQDTEWSGVQAEMAKALATKSA